MHVFLKSQLHLLAILVASSLAQGATRTWDGGASDGSFSNAMNWDGDLTIPVSGTDFLQVGLNQGSTAFIGFDRGSEFRTPSLTFLDSVTTAYDVTAGSVSDSLTLTGTGTTLLNASPIRQKFDLITTTLASSQTWDGGTAGFLLAQIDLGNNFSLTLTGGGVTASTQIQLGGGITGTGSAGLIKTGVGTVLLNSTSASDYTGSTTLSAGTLQLGRANQIPNGSAFIAGGGTFATGGFDEVLGTLTLSGSTTFDFGSSNTSDLVFSDSHTLGWGSFTLNIVNFDSGQDTLRVGTSAAGLTAAQLSEIKFNTTTPAQINSSGFVSPVPELAAWQAVGLGSFLLIGLQRRRRSPLRQ